MATSKSGGSTSNGRDSRSKRRGVKLFDLQKVLGGEVIVRQLGTKIHAGCNVVRGRDDSLVAVAPGYIKFHYGKRGRKYVSVFQENRR